MEAENVFQVQAGYFFSSNCVSGRDIMGHFCQMVDHYQDGIKALGFGKTGNTIYRKGGPSRFSDFNGFQEAVGGVAERLGAGTNITMVDIAGYKFAHLGPIVISEN